MSDERGDLTPQELDELASAYLDGEATPEEAALVESDPGLQALVEELRAVRDLVAAPVEAPSDEVRDQMIARALDHQAPVVSLDTARRRLRAIPTPARVILAAAAVVAALVLVGVAMFDQTARDDDDMFASESAPVPAMADEPAMDMLESAPAAEERGEVAAAEVPAEGAESGLAMADESSEAVQLVEEVPLVFDTQESLEKYAMQLVDDIARTPRSDSDESTDLTDSLACPLYEDEDEEFDLLARFVAVVEKIELEVSIYTGPDFAQQELLLVQTILPPDCATYGPVTALAWSTSP